MADTFFVSHRAEDPMFSVLQPDSAYATDHPYLIHAVALGVYNRPGSGKTVNIVSAAVEPWQGAVSTAYDKCLLGRVSAVSGGEDIVPLKFDSTSASLPSQVKILRYPSELTATGGPYRSYVDGIQRNIVAQPFPMAPLTGQSVNNQSTDCLVNCAFSECQNIVLREGQGLSVNNGLKATSYQCPLEVQILLNVAGATYGVTTVVAPAPNGLVVVFNGSGSGVVLEVVRVSVHELRIAIGSGTSPTLYVVERFEAMDPTSGSAPESIVPADTSAPLPASIVVRAGAVAKTYGAARGAFIAKPAFHANPPPEYPIVGGSAGSIYALNRYTNRFSARSGYDPWVLQEGEGIGFFVRSANATHPNTMSMTFTVQPAVSGGGAFTFAG